MNWGYKILLVIVVFVSGILFMVYKSTTTVSEMVTSDYYEKELVYQKTIDAQANVNDLEGSVNYNLENDQLAISFPNDFAGKTLEGEVTLYYPSDKSKDIVQKFSLQDSRILIPVNTADKKGFTLQLSWQCEGKSYYFEKKIFVQ